MKTPLNDGLQQLARADRVRLHMPGHKGQLTVDGSLDVTEIPGADNLHDASGIIRDCEREIARVYGARESRLLVGSTTAGIHAAILAGASEGDTVLVADCAHKSVYSALMLGRITPAFVTTPLDADWRYFEGVTAAQVAAALDAHPEAKGLVLTSPTYYGTVSETAAIARVLHARGKWLIVDEAHGAHLTFSEKLPQDAVSAGADIVVQSTHKMLAAPTQSAVLHVCSDRIDLDKCDFYLRTLQSSSPSYLLMAGIEKAVADADARGKTVFDAITARHDAALHRQDTDANIVLLDVGADSDKTKWLFGVRDGSGLAIAEELRARFGIFLELETPQLLLAYTGIGTTARDLDALTAAMAALNTPAQTRQAPFALTPEFPGKYNQHVPLWRAMTASQTRCDVMDCVGQIAADMVMVYPPGVPIILPGDKLTEAHAALLRSLAERQITCLGVTDGKLAVMK